MEYYRQFPAAILQLEVCSIVLLTRPPLTLAGSYDLHALAMPPAFTLSHDQTLQLISCSSDLRRLYSEVVNQRSTMVSDISGKVAGGIRRSLSLLSIVCEDTWTGKGR